MNTNADQQQHDPHDAQGIEAPADQHDQAAQLHIEPPIEIPTSLEMPDPPPFSILDQPGRFPEPQEEPEEPPRRAIGDVSFTALFGDDRTDTSELAAAVVRPVWIEALKAEGAVRILKISDEMRAQQRIYAEDEGDTAQNEVARRAARNRRRILLALELCAVSPSFTAEEAAAAIEAAEGSLIALPLFNSAALLNSIFQLEPLEDAPADNDPILTFAKAQARSVAILQSEKAQARLNSVLAQSRYDPNVNAQVKPALDLAELITDLLTSPRLDLLDRLASALEARNAPADQQASAVPSAPTAALGMAHAQAADMAFKEGS